MRGKRENATMIGVGVAACAVCCAGPIIGFLAAIGLGTAVGFAMFGAVALILGGVTIVIVLTHRRQRSSSCDSGSSPVALEMPTVRRPR